MALITQIRKRSSLIIALIALGVFGFILMDIQGNRSIAGTGSTLGTVAGENIDYMEFQNVEEALFKNSTAEPYARRSFLWEYLVDKVLVTKEADKLGLGVSTDEMKDLAFGNNLSPVIQQQFADQQTGRIDRTQLNEVKKAIENNTLPEEGRRAWAEVEREIFKEKLQEKFSNLVVKGIYTPNFMAEALQKERDDMVDLTYVKVPFETINDDQVKLEDSDYAAYLKENKGAYTSDQETRRVSFVVFDVKPTAKDSADVRGKIEAIINAYKTSTEPDSVFVPKNNGQMTSIYVKKAELEGMLKDTAASLPVGTIFGPYIENNAYYAFKIIDKKSLPDSVKSRHILLQASTPGDIAKAQKTIDSLKVVIETGKNSFDSLALRFGQDASRDKGGDLGYVAQGQMVPEFNDLIFNKAVPNKLYTVKTQFGVHLVEVTGQKFVDNKPGVKFSLFREALVPSEETQAAAEDKANKFLAENKSVDDMKKSTAGSKEIELIKSIPLKANDYSLGVLGAGEASYSIIKWAFTGEAKIGDIAPNVYSFKNAQEFYIDKYVVAGLSGIQKAGMPDVAAVKDDIKTQVINRKKGEMIKAKITTKDLNAIAANFTTKVDSATGVNFAAPFVAGIGNEPKVLAKAFKLGVNTTSDPIIGNSGVFVINPISKTPGAVPPNMALIKNSTSSQYASLVAPKVMEALRKTYKIKDNRYKFFN
ncbi:MAG TPA: peptidylprolyl isomerase [Saprospiraceae bacterium]|nr:peptidylprolyl isomerase [Saprospiraceae bacterium]MCC6688258.1 peptidylprolyl isomerase [Saprospiraceae bacterium]HMW74587.1 peptidylprolyl isomerase [Saprospiraceae bacterium]HMX81765.1 peptidylprolyl isomerase [Saprospiraceae bacterium]HMX84342.1 peptidylprolyl isomerase [Saprospiraceae bacterium]